MNVKNFKEFKEWTRGKSDSTTYGYKNTLKQYCEFRGMNPEELIDEYLEDRQHEDPREYGKPERELRKYKEKLDKKVENEEMSPATRQQLFSRIKSFYSFWDCDIDFQIPKGEPVNQKKKLRKKEIRKLVDHSRTPRDKAIIMMGFQTGMGVQEICNLNYGPISESIENEEPPIRIRTKRHKTESNFETYLGENGLYYLKEYLNERISKHGEPDYNDPLFVKSGKKRITPRVIQKNLKRIALRSGVVSKEKMENTKQNPARFHAIRTAFSSLCKLKGIAKEIRETWMGHSRPYKGAYDKYTVEELKAKYRKVEPELTIRETEEAVVDIKEEVDEFKANLGEEAKERRELENEIEDQREKTEELEEGVEFLKEAAESKDEMLTDLLNKLADEGLIEFPEPDKFSLEVGEQEKD